MPNAIEKVLNGNYRVRMVIYDGDEGPEEHIALSDEPLFSHEDEIAAQAYRTQRHFLQKLAHDQ